MSMTRWSNVNDEMVDGDASAKAMQMVDGNDNAEAVDMVVVASMSGCSTLPLEVDDYACQATCARYTSRLAALEANRPNVRA